jgi:hypothetical protein
MFIKLSSTETGKPKYYSLFRVLFADDRLGSRFHNSQIEKCQDDSLARPSPLDITQQMPTKGLK